MGSIKKRMRFEAGELGGAQRAARSASASASVGREHRRPAERHLVERRARGGFGALADAAQHDGDEVFELERLAADLRRA